MTDRCVAQGLAEAGEDLGQWICCRGVRSKRLISLQFDQPARRRAGVSREPRRLLRRAHSPSSVSACGPMPYQRYNIESGVRLVLSGWEWRGSGDIGTD